MVTILCITYTALVVLLFKFKLLKPRPYPIAGVVVAGVLLIGGVVVAWHQYAPMSPRVVTTQFVVQLVPYVKGQVKKVHAQPNQPLRKGDLLLEINPEPYQYKVNQVEADLASAKDNVKLQQASVAAADASVVKAVAGITQAQAAISQYKAALANAQASLVKAKASVLNAQAGVTKARAAADLARTEEEIDHNLQKKDPGAIIALRVTQTVQNRLAADAALKQAEAGTAEAAAGQKQADAGVGQAQAALQQADAGLAEAQSAQRQAEAAARQAAFALKMAQSNVPSIQAQLDDARFNLEQCRMLAPADGYVVNWQVQDGTMLVPAPLAAAGTFISTSETYVAAAFPQNYLPNVRAGDPVEVVLDPYPGRVFQGEVESVITATGEGQFVPGGTIPDASKVGSQGLLAVKIRLTGEPPPNLPLGAGGDVAIYTDRGKPVHIISKVALRMKKWLLYRDPGVAGANPPSPGFFLESERPHSRKTDTPGACGAASRPRRTDGRGHPMNPRWRWGRLGCGIVVLSLFACGCTSLTEFVHNGFKVGPNYQRPPAPLAPAWIDAANPQVKSVSADYSAWWTVFGDPVLNELVRTAYAQNVTLRVAGTHVLEARAQRAIAVGTLFPQQQTANGALHPHPGQQQHRQRAPEPLLRQLGHELQCFVGDRLLG